MGFEDRAFCEAFGLWNTALLVLLPPRLLTSRLLYIVSFMTYVLYCSLYRWSLEALHPINTSGLGSIKSLRRKACNSFALRPVFVLTMVTPSVLYCCLILCHHLIQCLIFVIKNLVLTLVYSLVFVIGVMIAWAGIEHFRMGRYDPPPPACEPEDAVVCLFFFVHCMIKTYSACLDFCHDTTIMFYRFVSCDIYITNFGPFLVLHANF